MKDSALELSKAGGFLIGNAFLILQIIGVMNAPTSSKLFFDPAEGRRGTQKN